MTEGSGTSSLFEATRLGLSRITLRDAGELTRALEHACQASAQALAVERVGIWFVSNSGEELHCATLYEASKGQSTKGAVLRLASMPGYLQALEARRVLSVSSATDTHVSQELRDTYLSPLDIRATLDAPVFRMGEIVVRLLLERIAGRTEPVHEVIAPKLMARNTTAPVTGSTSEPRVARP